MFSEVAIPLGQGQVFNATAARDRQYRRVAIPLGQGQVFNGARIETKLPLFVAIPLGQGQVFNQTTRGYIGSVRCRNPFGSGTGF